MALIIKPYESRREVRTAGNPGPAARSRSAEEFGARAGSADRGLPSALANLSRGLDRLGSAVASREKATAAEKLQVDLARDVLSHQTASAEFYEKYVQSRQGEAAIFAERDFWDFQKQRLEELYQKYESRPEARREVLARAEKTVAESLRAGGDYGRAQLSAYKRQVLQGQMERTLAAAGAEPDRWEPLAADQIGRLAEMFPHQSPEERRAEAGTIRAETFQRAFEALLESDDRPRAEEFLSRAEKSPAQAGPPEMLAELRERLRMPPAAGDFRPESGGPGKSRPGR